MAVRKYPNIEFKTPDWLTATELASEYIVGTPVKIRRVLLENENLECIQRKRHGTNVALCLHRDYVSYICKISGLQIAEKLPQKTRGWLTAYELSMLYIRGGQFKILNLLNEYKNKMPTYIKKMRSGKNIVLCLNHEALDAFCDLGGLKRKNELDAETSGEEKEPETRKYRVPDVLVSMPPLLCSLFGREESR